MQQAYQLGEISHLILQTELLTGMDANGNFFLQLLRMDHRLQIILSRLVQASTTVQLRTPQSLGP